MKSHHRGLNFMLGSINVVNVNVKRMVFSAPFRSRRLVTEISCACMHQTNHDQPYIYTGDVLVFLSNAKYIYVRRWKLPDKVIFMHFLYIYIDG